MFVDGSSRFCVSCRQRKRGDALTISVNTACDLDDVSFMLVEATVRAWG